MRQLVGAANCQHLAQIPGPNRRALLTHLTDSLDRQFEAGAPVMTLAGHVQ